MEWNDLKQVLGKALHYLSAQEIELIELRYFESKSFAEIGFILQVTENNAKVKTYRAIDKLKQKFSVLQ
jgi:RNA polymerase sigma-70 factor (ECF subfamily)